MKNELLDLGLDETEIKVYLAMLRLGPSGVSEISKAADIKRTLGYHVLGKLGVYGLVDQVISKKNKQVFSARHPRQLVQFAERKERAWGRRAQSVESILPDLLSMYKVGEKPDIRYQEGVQGVITLFEESLESKSDILSIFDIESWQNSDFWEWALVYFKERNKRKITERLLMLDTPAARKWIKDYDGSRVYSIYKWVKPEDVTNLLQFG
jgi:sugar-specific transcriptional regulator TrmB